MTKPIEIIPMVITADHVMMGGDLGGAYLEDIGKTDLATLTQEEWLIFCARIVAGALSPTDQIPF